jgi:4-hydroxy-tetrahydrodipicolinate synthase
MITPGNIKIDGIVPIIPTIFDEKERIDWSAFEALLDFACGIDVCAICLPAYASEFYKLSDAERREVIDKAVEQSDHRVPVVAQANAGSALHTVELARFAQEAGAAAVSVAAPRMFAISENDLLRHFDRILSAIDIPLVLQDFNPGGPTVSTSFITKLHRQHPHFRWVKLEEPLMAARIASILEATSGQVGVLEGWGGMYLLELVTAGICGVMPSLSLADLLARIFRLAEGGQRQEAYEVFTGVLPQIVFSLQNMELYHHAEKRLLAVRGIINETFIRDPRLELSPFDAAHIDFLNANILALLDRLKMPRFPRSVKALEISTQHRGTKVHDARIARGVSSS